MAIFLFILAALFLGAGIYLLVIHLRKFVKDKTRTVLDKKLKLFYIGALASIGVSGALLQAGINVAAAWEMSSGAAAASVFGQGMFFFAFSALWTHFYLYFYKPDLEAKQRKAAKIVMLASIPVSALFFLLCGEGVADFLPYPLCAGIVINGQGLHFVNYDNWSGLGGVHIAWYGVIMISGAVVSYLICDHRFYKEFRRHGILENLLPIAFVGGVLGARIWYVVGNWNGDPVAGINFCNEVNSGNWLSMFQVWNGGLTILGGAVGGMIVGIIYMIRRRNYVDVRFAIDVIVPTILVAQCIGRWGNFFNHEVYGAKVAMADWSILPTWLVNQMSTAFANGKVASTDMYVPLFLIEGSINLLGYFVIAWIVPAIWKKGRALGVLGGCYLVWYGVTRMIMEPLRDPNFNMGSNGMWSFWNSMLYIILGGLMIAGFQLFAFYRKSHPAIENHDRTVGIAESIISAAFVLGGGFLVVIGLLNLSGDKKNAYLFVLILGIALLLGCAYWLYRSIKRILRSKAPAKVEEK